MTNDAVANKLRACYVFLALCFLAIATAIVINLIQANQTGAGSGINDTKILTPSEARNFFRDQHVPESQH
jgi:hypothetical protein